MPWNDNSGGGGGWSGGGGNNGGNRGGGNNPWGSGGGGGRRGGGMGGGGRPPELDELLRQSQNRMKNMFGGKGGGIGVLALAAIGLIAWVATGFYTVGPAQQGIVLRFGEFVEITTPGINYHLPSPIERVIKVDVEAQNQINIGFRGTGTAVGRTAQTSRNVPEESIMLTGDENIVDIEFAVIWRIIDAPAFLFNIQDQEGVIKAVAESAMREVVGRTPVQAVITTERDRVRQEVTQEIQRSLDEYEAGVLVTQVVLQKADPPEQVIEAVRDVQSARADRERARNEGEAYRNRVLNEAEGQARRIREAAEAFKQERITIATGEADRFARILVEYDKNPEVVRTRMYLEAMEEVLASMDKLILDQQQGSGAVPYLSLQELLRRPGGTQQ